MRQTWGKMKPKIMTKQLPLAFGNINAKPKSKKGFQQFQKLEQQKKQTDNFFIDRIDDAVASEEFNKMQNMLEPLNLVSQLLLSYLTRPFYLIQDRGRAAFTKIDQYNSNLTNQNPVLKRAGGNEGSPGRVGIDNFFQLKGQISKPVNTKEHLSQSSGFESFKPLSI